MVGYGLQNDEAEKRHEHVVKDAANRMSKETVPFSVISDDV